MVWCTGVCVRIVYAYLGSWYTAKHRLGGCAMLLMLFVFVFVGIAVHVLCGDCRLCVLGRRLGVVCGNKCTLPTCNTFSSGLIISHHFHIISHHFTRSRPLQKLLFPSVHPEDRRRARLAQAPPPLGLPHRRQRQRLRGGQRRLRPREHRQDLGPPYGA